MTDFDKIVNEFSDIKSVKAIVMSGSRTAGTNDALSDTDLYIYTNAEIPLELRKGILDKYTKESELDNRYWELGDEMILKDSGEGLDIMYRSPEWIESVVSNVWDKHLASLGYTTAFLHNVKTSKILFDRDGWFAKLQNKISSDYPQALSDNIIEKNLPLLKEKKYASYYDQIKNALERKDYVSVNHRLTAFFSSYFDIIFALNKIFHPGEKRLVKYVRTRCKIVPPHFEEDVEGVLCSSYDTLLQRLNLLIMHLYEVL